MKKVNKNKLIGLGIIIGCIVLAIVLVSFTTELEKNASESCSCTQEEGATCAHQQGLPWQSYVGFLFLFALIILGTYLISKKEEQLVKRTFSKVLLKDLDKEEKKIFELIQQSNGTIFQSELAEKSGFDKVKVTRILDKLEGRQIITRMRRGMTNVVILK